MNSKSRKYNILTHYYDSDADVLYISIGTPVPSVSEDLGDGIHARFSFADGTLSGFTVLNTSLKRRNQELDKTVSG